MAGVKGRSGRKASGGTLVQTRVSDVVREMLVARRPAPASGIVAQLAEDGVVLSVLLVRGAVTPKDVEDVRTRLRRQARPEVREPAAAVPQ
jgi:hypothetical protein